MKRLFTALLMLAILGTSCEAFATAVTFENLHYGQEAFELHVNDQPNFIVFQGEEYSLNDNAASYTGKTETYGGKTRAVYEMTVPADGYAASDSGEATVLGEWVQHSLPCAAVGGAGKPGYRRICGGWPDRPDGAIPGGDRHPAR